MKALVHDGLRLTWKYINVRTRDCAQRANHLLAILENEKVVSLCDTCTRKTLHLRFKVCDEHDSILSVGRFNETAR